MDTVHTVYLLPCVVEKTAMHDQVDALWTDEEIEVVSASPILLGFKFHCLRGGEP